MSADFWNSTQRTKWQLTRHLLFENRRKLLLLERKMIHNGLIKDYPGIVFDANMRIYLHNLLVKLGRRLNIRQIALATAEVYLLRFLTRVSLKEINVYLLVAACLYVACKIEECPQHIRLITSEARNLWPEYVPQDITKLAEFEFYLIEELDSYLVVHHPYKSLLQLREYLAGHQSHGFTLTDEELQNSWSIINDSYITDLHLLFPPHVIAVTAVYITVVLNKPGKRDGKSGHGHGQASGGQGSGGSSQQHGSNQSSSGTGNGQHSGQHQQVSNQPDIHIDDLMALSYTVPVSEANHALRTERFRSFMASSHVNLDEVAEALQDLINLYAVWNRYNEGSVKKALQYMLLSR
ncbi:RNA polymerase II holoenzyme cyclin-like subunit [[Candida] anglica]